MNRTRVATVAALAITAASLTGCGGDDKPKDDFTFQGATVSEPEKALKTFEGNWRSHIASSETQVRLGKDAGCFFQVMDKEITTKLLCGPFRQAESEKTAWSSTGLIGYPSQDGKTTVGFADMEGVNWDDNAEPLPNAVPMNAAGKKADTAQVVEQPDAKELATGQALMSPQDMTSTGDLKQTRALAIDGNTWVVNTTGTTPQRYAGTGKDRRQAPEGGTIVSFGIRHNVNTARGTTQPQEAEKSTTFTLTSGGKTITLPKPPVTGSMTATWVVSVPGDGKDAKVNITAAKGTQTVALADGKLTGVTEGWDPDMSGSNVSSQPLTNQTECDRDSQQPSDDVKSSFTNHVGLNCTVKWEVSPYNATKGWAPKGTQWWTAWVKPSTTQVMFKDSNGVMADSYKTSVTLTGGDLDGQKQTAISKYDGKDEYSGAPLDYQGLTFSVKLDSFPKKLTITGDGKGTKGNSSWVKEAPATWARTGLTGVVATD